MNQIPMFDPIVGPVFPPARQFQEHAHSELRAGFMAGARLQVVMAPTGAGKTYLALRLCSESLARGKRCVFICDRKTLINQTSAVADGYGMPTHGVIQATHPRMALWRPFQIASAQTIASRGLSDDFDLVVVDEAHTLYKPVTTFIKATRAAVIGLSATPFTKGLGKIYDRVINAATMGELTRQGILTPLRILSCKRPDMDGAKKTSSGEWTPQAAEDREMALVGDVVLEWAKHANNAKTIVFGPTVLHCEELVRRFIGAGIGAATFCGVTPDDEREALLKEYRKPESKIRVLVSVEALAKGFDVPDVGCICDCRPLRKSLSTFIQMIGRGLRSSPGKTECVLLDFSGNVIRFADDFARIYWDGLATLDDGEKLDKEPRDDKDHEPKSCPKCGATPCGKRCIKCGFEAVVRSLVEHGAGRAEEVDILGTGNTKYAKSRLELFNALATYAKARGHKPGAAAHRYKEITGSWPPRSFSFDAAPHTPMSAALKGKVASLRIAFHKRPR